MSTETVFYIGFGIAIGAFVLQLPLVAAWWLLGRASRCHECGNTAMCDDDCTTRRIP